MNRFPVRRTAIHLFWSICCFFATIARLASAQTQTQASGFPAKPAIELLTSGTKTSLRGLSVVSDKVVWVSGSSGQVGKSVDGGKTWKWITVPEYEKRDFRDIEAFDKNTAIIMAIAEPAVILKTTDGGKSWRLVYQNETKGMFLDAMEFWNVRSGIVVGDPVNGRFFVARTFDGGDSWHEIPTRYMPQAEPGEGCFAASGTNIRYLDRVSSCFVSGGIVSRVFIRDSVFALPILQGKASTGAFSIAVKDNQKEHGGNQLIVVGGDYANDTIREKNCFVSNDGGKTWIYPAIPPHGFRSCVEYIGGQNVLCSGTSGVDFSSDDGMHWTLISNDSFHVCRRAKAGKAIFLAGGNGRIGKLNSVP